MQFHVFLPDLNFWLLSSSINGLVPGLGTQRIGRKIMHQLPTSGNGTGAAALPKSERRTR